MARFTVRVELHGKDHDDEVYDELHDVMEAHGFPRWVTNSQTKGQFWLPHAEYRGNSDKSPSALAAEVQGWVDAETSHDDAIRVLATQGDAGWVTLKPKT